MRMKNAQQKQLVNPAPNHIKAKEYQVISDILDSNSEIYDLAYNDLVKHPAKTKAGAKGMTAEQVVKAAIVKQKEGYSYEDLEFHLMDSDTCKDFLQIGIAQKGFKKSALCANIKSLSAETWEKINEALLAYSKQEGIEKGREVRIDCTVVESNIHDPHDSDLLWDCTRVLTRHLEFADESFSGLDIQYNNNTTRAKRRMTAIHYARTKKQRKPLYTDLLKVTTKTRNSAEKAVEALEELGPHIFEAQALAVDMKNVIQLTDQVIDQTKKRVFEGISVAASDKIVSIFEPHTDIIIKDRRETYFGHKICITGGKSNLILDCNILEGNPADSTLTQEMVDRQFDIYTRFPLKVSFDGGFASKNNLNDLKDRCIKDVCFSKKRGMDEKDMCRSRRVYKRLRNFRAGIESGISWLKRSFGLGVCIWKGLRSFRSYVWASIVAANLTTLARIRLTPAES
ncbi:MAG: ISNCY family transposase [Desulfobacteraceae bacterium]|nr:ISNCY family transposase [Desulfobacteraceae bacterium]